MGEEVENFFWTCNDSIIFIVRGVLTGCYKIVLQGLTFMLAIKIRNVKIPALDDTRYVAVTVYVAVALSVIVVVTSLTLISYPTAYASIFAASSVIGGASFLGLLFVPKVSGHVNTYIATSRVSCSFQTFLLKPQ